MAKTQNPADKLPEIVIVPAAKLRATINRASWPFRTPIGSVLSLENPGFRPTSEKNQVRRGYAPRLDPSRINQRILQVEDSHALYAYSPATAETIRQIADFADEHMDQRRHMKFAIQCAQGISRSPAAALTVAIAFRQAAKLTTEPRALVKWLMKKRPAAAPDETIVALTDQHFDFKGDLIRAVAEHPQIRENRERHRRRLVKHRLPRP